MRYVFGECTLDTEQYVLYRAHRSIALQPKVFQVMYYLLTHRDRVVAKAELNEQVWPEQFISDATLAGVIKAVRQAVGDDGRTQWCIQTRRGQGYRFVAPLEELVVRQKDAAVSGEAPFPVSPPLRALLPAVPTHVVPETSRRQLTVLFCDLIDSTPLAVQLDPEDLRKVMLAYYTACAEVAQRFEGTIVQYLGDGLLLFFGYPQAHEDAAQRAIHTGLGILEALTTLNTRLHHEHGVHLRARLGIHTGMVIVGQGEEQEKSRPMAFGDIPHIASRLQNLASANQVVISEPMWRLAGGGFDYEDLGVQALRGVAIPLRVYHVRGTRAVVSRFDAATISGLSALVGREEEVRLILRRWEQAQAGEGQVVLLAGEAGMGKSRLARAVLETVATAPHTAVAYQCVPHYRHSAFYPLRVQLEDAAQFARHDTTAQKLDKLERLLAHTSTDIADIAPLFAALLSLPTGDRYPPVSLVPERQRAKTIEALVGQMVGLAERQPVLCLMEDVQWSDPTTLEVLNLLVHHVPTIRALVIITSRPEFTAPWRTATHVTALTLNRLDRAQSTVLVEQVTAGKALPAAVVRQIVAQADGMPLFVEELTKTVRESPWLAESPDGYDLLGPLSLLAIPSTLQDALTERLDRLGTAKVVAQLAATIGREFSAALLQAVLPADADALQDALAQLVEAEIIYPRGRHPEATYVFKHALIQGTAYRSLLRPTRQEYHCQIAQVLAERFAETVATQPEILAHHTLRGEVWGKAVPYCQQAGARAYDRAAFGEAVAYFEQALQALAHLPEHGDTKVLAIELRLTLQRPLAVMGAYGRCLALLGEAEALARALADCARLGEVLAQRANVLRITGNLDGAMVAGQQALELAVALGDNALQVYTSHRLGQVYYAMGDFGRAVELLRRSVAVADREFGRLRTDMRIDSRAWLARTLSPLGAFAEGRCHGEEALRLATPAGRGQTLIVAHGCLGLLYLAQGDLERAIRALEQGLALCRASGNRTWLSGIAAGLGSASALQGRLAEGRALLEEAISENIRTGARQRPFFLAWLSEICRLAGRGEEAWQYARQALDLARQQTARGEEALALHQRGVIHAHAAPPDVAQAAAHYRQALTLAEELGMRPLQAHCHLGLGTLYAKISRPDPARTSLSAAIVLYRAMNMTFWLPQAEALLAQVEGR